MQAGIPVSQSIVVPYVLRREIVSNGPRADHPRPYLTQISNKLFKQINVMCDAAHQPIEI
jgi:hypothetical protein